MDPCKRLCMTTRAGESMVGSKSSATEKRLKKYLGKWVQVPVCVCVCQALFLRVHRFSRRGMRIPWCASSNKDRTKWM